MDKELQGYTDQPYSMDCGLHISLCNEMVYDYSNSLTLCSYPGLGQLATLPLSLHSVFPVFTSQTADYTR